MSAYAKRSPSILKHAPIAAAIGLAAGLAPAPASAELVFGLLSNNSLVSFDSSAPGVTTAAINIQGLGANEQLRSIDFRPATQQLYGLVVTGPAMAGQASTLRLVTINTATGASTPVAQLQQGGGTGNVSTIAGPAIAANGQQFGGDFNPAVDLFRVVSDANQNLAANPGAPRAGVAGATRTDGNLNLGGDPNSEASRGLNIVAAAYDRNVAGTAQTTLFVLDNVSDTLYTQGSVNGAPTSPNTGTLLNPLQLVDANGNPINLIGDAGFDISGMTGTAFVSSDTADADQLAEFFLLNTATGMLTALGTIGGQGGASIIDVSVSNVPEPASLALFGAGLIGLALSRKRRAVATA
jgi:hypothetical protein